MKCPKILNDVIATYIGMEVINGVHYYNILNEEKKKISQSQDLENLFAQYTDENKDSIKIEDDISGGRIVIVNPYLCEAIVKKQIEGISAEHKEFQQIINHIDIEKSKEKECKLLAEEVLQRKTDFDIFLFKMKGLRRKEYPVTINGEEYRKVINGYKLTIDDIGQVNKYVAKYGLKITSVQPCEMFDREAGVRYALKIGKADIL